MTNHSPVRYTSAQAGSRLNTELLERVRQIILMHPELHDQQTWGQTDGITPVGVISARAEAGEFCGTTACVAGWAAILSAPKDALVHSGGVYYGGTGHNVSGYAAKQLGLTWDQQIWLFTAEATRERVLWTLKWLPDHPDAGTPELQQAWREEMSAQRPEDWL